MKVLHLVNFYHSQSGGIKTYLDNKRRYLIDRGLPFRMVVPDEEDAVEELEPDSVIYRIASPPAPFNPLYRIIYNVGVVNKIVRHEKPDLIEVNDKFTLMGLSYIYHKITKLLPTAGFHHERLDVNLKLYWGENGFARWLARNYIKIFSAAFDRIFCASRYTAAEIEPVSPDKIELLNLGINLDRFDPAAADEGTRRRYADGADILLLYVGRLAKEKNLALLPPAIRQLRRAGVRARLVLAGLGEEEAMLRSESDGDIQPLGYIGDRELLARLYASADVFVFPSPSEPYGLVPLEALASGTPVVCPNSGGVLEYSDSPAVRAVEPTPEAFAAAITDLAGRDRRELRRLAREQAERFPWEKTFDRQMEICREMVAKGVTVPGSVR